MLAKILRPLSPIVFIAAAFTLIAPSPLVAQAAPSLVTNRITQPINENARVTLKGTVHPLANAANDRGAAPDSMPLDRIQVVLKRSDAQESALKQLINDLHTPGSPSYHKWLTPDQFGKQFGPSDQDIATVESWLQSHGFSITKLNAGKQTLEISGNVAQFRNTFHAQIHKYVVNGETHYANANDPQIPAGLAPVVGGFASLNNFHVRSQHRYLGTATYNLQTHESKPQWTYGNNSGVNFVLAPGDFAKQYDLPAASSGTNGTGQTIAIVNDSNINIYLVNQFRSLFGLSANPPQIIIDGNDPGIDGINNPDGPNYDSAEAYIDVEWSGATAPNATVDLVIGTDTALESGLILALEHAIYGNIAPVLSLSFGTCEYDLGSYNAFLSGLWEQAAAQGITALVAAGDAGSAACDDDDTQYYAVNGQAVSGYASTPYNVAVGGTDFYYSDYATGGASIANYWNTTPSQNPTTSLQQVIPEQPWNDSQYGLDILDYYTLSGNMATTIAGGGGGASNCATGTYDSDGNTVTCTAGYAKPSWQKGTGVPADNVRDVPDLSLFAADGFNYSYYPVCYADADCQPASGSNLIQISGFGGTSVASPAFAGIMALVNQMYGRQGQADFVLYPLASQFPAAFHDVTHGTNSVPCNINTTSTGVAPFDCISVSNPIDNITDPTYGEANEGQIGTGTTPQYNATTGYDLASGLGSVDASVLIADWNNVTFTTTTTTLTPSSTSFTHGTSITVSGSVTPASGTATGNVALMTDSTEPVQQGQGISQLFTENTTPSTFALSNGSYSGSVNYLPGGTYNIWGQYSGDGTNGPSTSAKTSITVTPEASTTYFNVLDVATGVPITSGTTNIPYGTQLILAAEPYPTTYYNQCVAPSSPPSSCSTATYTFPTGTVAFADNGTPINTAVVNAEGDAEYNAPWSIGNHSVTAAYSGDNSYNKSSASAFTFSIAKDTPEINAYVSIETTSGALVGGQSNVFTIQVLNTGNLTNEQNYSVIYSNPTLPPTGTVTISGFPSGVPTSATLQPGVDAQTSSAAGIATITIPSSVAAGSYNVTISYPGDGNYASTTPPSFPVTIQSVGGLTSTTTASISGSISPSTTVTLSGTVTGQSGHPAPGNSNGGVLIYSSGYGLFNGYPVPTTPGIGDTSTFSVSLSSQSLLQGSNAITVQYMGDTNYAPSAVTLANPISSPLSDFSIVPETTIVPVTATTPGTDTINLSSVNGFAGTVSFTCTATTVTCNVNSSANLSAGSTAPLALTISAASSVANGDYNVLVKGVDSAGQFVHTLAIEAVVSGSTAAPGFALSSSPTTLTLAAGATTGNTSAISVTPSGGFTGTVDLTCAVTGPSGATSPATCSLNPTSASISGNLAFSSTLTVDTTTSTTPGAYTVTVTGTSGTLTPTTTVAVTVASPTAPNFTLSASPTTLSLTGGATTGNTSAISVTPSNSFTGNVALACSVIGPSGATSPATCALNPATAMVSGTGAVTSTLTVSTTTTTTAGTYTVTVTGTSGTLSSNATVTATVAVAPSASFTLSASSSSVSITAGSSGTLPISVTPSNGFTGSVALTCSSSNSAQVSCSLNPTTADVTGTSAVTSNLTIAAASTSAGSYTVTVTGTSGTISQTTTVAVAVAAAPTPSFTLSASSSSVSITAGSSGTLPISVMPTNGFTGNVALTCSSSNSAQVSCNLNPTTADVTSSSAAMSTLTIAAGSNSGALDRPLNKFFAIGGGAALALLVFFGIPARRRSWRAILGVVLFGALVGFGIGCGSSGGNNNNTANYTVTVTGTSGSITQSTTISVTVTTN